jgi:hypothetical protein
MAGVILTRFSLRGGSSGTGMETNLGISFKVREIKAEYFVAVLQFQFCQYRLSFCCNSPHHLIKSEMKENKRLPIVIFSMNRNC